MKIVKVKYSHLVSDGQYNNESFGAEALVEDGETPEDARTNLIYWVNEILEKKISLEQLRNEEYELLGNKETIERQIVSLTKKANGMMKFLEGHGVDVSSIRNQWDDIPF